MEELILLVVLLAALLWVKNKFISPETSKKIDIFLSRGVTLVKSLLLETADKTASTDKTPEVQKTETHQAPVQQPTADLERSQVEELKNIEVSVIQDINNTADSCQEPNDIIPEDSVLRRHYLTQLAAERESITHPYPTDSVLRRHYESMFALANQPTRANKPKIDLEIAITAPSEKQQIPEDAVLRRHFLTQLQSEVESTLCPRPTDATLKRHYDTLVRVSVAKRLVEMAS